LGGLRRQALRERESLREREKGGGLSRERLRGFLFFPEPSSVHLAWCARLEDSSPVGDRRFVLEPWSFAEL
jgi:hypothetical protein